MEDVDPTVATTMLDIVRQQTRDFLESCGTGVQGYAAFFLKGYDRRRLATLQSGVEEATEYLSNHRNKLLVNKLSSFPILRNLWLYNVTPQRWMAWTAIILLPIGVPLWLTGRRWRKELVGELRSVLRATDEVEALL